MTFADTTENTPATAARTISQPRIMLGIEGFTVLASCIALYIHLGASGWVFAALFLAPDLTFIPFAFNQQLGVHLYNVVHTYALPIALGMLALAAGWSAGLPLALIWGAHIGMDRVAGYGLKYPTAFKYTHLGRV